MSCGLLSTPLEQEYFLVKVFGCLLDDGLHECRLVCRRWYDVCSRMPVKLVDVPIERLPVVVDRFPNAVALSFYPPLEWNGEVVETIGSLARLKNLEAVKLNEASAGGVRIWNNLPLCKSLAEALPSCRHLQSLDFVPPFDGSNPGAEAGTCLYSRLSHLTGLTRLRLLSGWEQLVNDPFTEIRNIEDLGIKSVSLENGQLVFPHLTHLTHLSARLDVKAAEKFKEEALQVSACTFLCINKNCEQMFLPYASSLQSLEISFYCDLENGNTRWAFFREFRQLSSVDFVFVLFDMAQDFCAALDCMKLTHLRFKCCVFSADFVENISGVRSLTSLRSLQFQSFSRHAHKMFAAVPQLTSLRMWSITNIEPLTVLTALRDLVFSSTAQTLSNLSHAFSHMPNLESLRIYGDRRRWCSSSCFSHLKNLRSLLLNEISLDGDIFHTLAQLPELMELNLCVCLLPGSSTLSGINVLTNLKRLELWDVTGPVDQMSILMKGKLVELRYLTLASSNDDTSVWRSLHQTFPNLRQCLFRDASNRRIVYP